MCKRGPGDKTNGDINASIKRDKRKMETEVKLLLLGAGESGKSTIAKQMKIIHLKGFTHQERSGFKPTIYSNVLNSMSALIDGVEQFHLEFTPENKAAAQRITDLVKESLYSTSELSREVCRDIKSLWTDPAIKTTLFRSSEFHLGDSAVYYLSDVDRISAEGYTPNEQDILRARATTTGIYETEFDVEHAHFRMIDVGGQRTERKKWIHSFEGVTAVLFCVAMSEYDLKLLEDDKVNRMEESLQLFREVCNSHWFQNTAIILFLNKTDLFAEKIRKTPLTVCFVDYKGENQYVQAAKYVQDQFLLQSSNQDKPIYPHFTCATDTDNITVVFDAVRDIVLRGQLRDNGMM